MEAWKKEKRKRLEIKLNKLRSNLLVCMQVPDGLPRSAHRLLSQEIKLTIQAAGRERHIIFTQFTAH